MGPQGGPQVYWGHYHSYRLLCCCSNLHKLLEGRGKGRGTHTHITTDARRTEQKRSPTALFLHCHCAHFSLWFLATIVLKVIHFVCGFEVTWSFWGHKRALLSKWNKSVFCTGRKQQTSYSVSHTYCIYRTHLRPSVSLFQHIQHQQFNIFFSPSYIIAHLALGTRRMV